MTPVLTGYEIPSDRLIERAARRVMLALKRDEGSTLFLGERHGDDLLLAIRRTKSDLRQDRAVVTAFMVTPYGRASAKVEGEPHPVPRAAVYGLAVAAIRRALALYVTAEGKRKRGKAKPKAGHPWRVPAA